MKQLAATLKSMDVDIDDEELAMAALNGLPSSYESLIFALDALGTDEKAFTFDLVKSRLLQEEQRANERQLVSHEPKQSALVGVSGKGNSGFRGDFNPKQHSYVNHRCENCGNIGHSKADCWGKDVNGRRPPNPNPEDKPKSNSAFVGHHKNVPTQVINENDFVCLMAKINTSAYPKGASSWIVDSGCTAHICFDKSMFDTYEPIMNTKVEMGTKATATVAGRGSITVKMQCGNGFKLRKLEGVLHVPSFEYSLPSVSAIDKKGMKTTFWGGKCVIHKDDVTVVTGFLEGHLYVIHFQRVSETTEKSYVTSLQLWHERMAHIDKRGIVQMADRGVVQGQKIYDRNLNSKCEDCEVSKAHRSPIPKERTSEVVKGMLDRIHSDVCGPIEIPSLGGSRYFVTFIDEHSNWVTLYLLKKKSEVAERFLEYEKYAERQTGRKIRIIRSDRGGEYLSDSLSTYFKHQGIVHELTASYTPHQNGKSERFNRTAMELVRSMLHHRNVPKCFWAEALSTSVHVRNRATSRALPTNMTPYHIWKSGTQCVGYFRVFGCKCWYTIPKSEVKKIVLSWETCDFRRICRNLQGIQADRPRNSESGGIPRCFL